MRFKNWLNSLFSFASTRRTRCRPIGSTRLGLEALEDRVTPSYTVIDLGTLGGTYSDAVDVNSSGHVVGTSHLADGAERAFLWRDGAMTNLGTLGGIMSRAHAINDAGQVVGMSNLSGDAYAYRAFLLTPEDTDGNGAPDRWFRDTNGDGANDLMRNLGTLGGSNPTSVAYDVNNLGQVVGTASWSTSSANLSRAFLWQTGVMTNLGTGGGTHSSARAINDAGLITGWNYISGTSHAFLWKTGAMTDLGIADGGNDINNTGQVVVSSYYQPGRLWTPTVPNGTTGTFANLGVLPPSQPEFYADCSPQGMNNVGQVVGSSNEYEPWEGQLVAPRAFVWTNGVMEQVPLDVAAAINDAGQIAGTRASRAYLLTPVPPGTPRMTITGGSIVEGDSGVADLAFTVRLSVPGAGPVSVQYATANGAASAGSDYHATTGTLTFAPGEAERDIRIPVIGERVADGFVNEGFWVALSNASGAFVENGSAIGWIIDNEPRIAINDIFVVEGNSGSSTAILQIVLSNEYDQPVSVEYATADTLTPFAAATAGSDYVPVSGTALFYPGDTLFEVHIEVLGDRIAETYRDPFSQGYFNSERITLELTNPSSNVVASGVATIFINDDEPRVSVNPFVSVTEGDPTTPAAVFTVSLSARYDEDVFVNYTTMEVLDPYFTNATPGSDYVATSGVIRFAEGDTEETVEVPILDNSQIEFAEYFNFNISSLGSNVDIEGWNSLGLAEILDNEPPEISIGSVYQNEGNTGTTALTIWVVLSFESSQTVSVNFTTSDGTAIAGNDYQSTSGTLTFAPWETLQPVTVLVNGDRTVEPHETFFVNLSSATNATIADGEGVATIVDDEPRVSISDVTRTEGKKGKPNLFTFTVSLLAAYDQPVTMSFRTVNGTATTSDGDYVAKSGTLTFAAGETSKTITIEVKGDTKREANETFYLDLFGLSGNALFTKNRGIGTIVNDD